MTDKENESGSDSAEDERLRKMHDAVRAVPEPARGPVTREDVQTLREAQLGELAEIAERHVAHG